MLNPVYILYLAAALMDMSIADSFFALSRRAAELHATSNELGFLGGTFWGAYLIMALVTGHHSHRVGHRNIAIASCLIACAVTLTFAFVTQIGVLIGLNAIYGAAMGCYWPSIISLLGKGLSGPALSRRMTYFSISWNVGLLIGYGLTGFVFKHSPALAFYISGGAALLIAFLLKLPARETPMEAAAIPDVPREEIPKGRGFRKTAWMSNFAVSLSVGGAIAVFPLLATSLNISPDVHGVLQAGSRAAALATFVLMQIFTFWHKRLWPLWAAQILGALGVALLGWSDGIGVFAASFLLTGLVSGVTYQASIFFSLDETSEQGKGSGFHEAIVGSGNFLGPVLAGWVGQNHSLRSPYWFCSVALLFMVAMQMIFVWWRRTTAKPAQ